jgi:hypothetical protein
LASRTDSAKQPGLLAGRTMKSPTRAFASADVADWRVEDASNHGSFE